MFFKTFLIVSSYFLSIECNKLIFKPEKFYKTCHFNKVDFWKFYYWMFQNYNHMHISTFEIEHESAILQRFLNEILASVADHGLLQKSFTVKNYILSENDMDERRRYCPNANNLVHLGNSSELIEEERRLNRLCQDDKIENAECPPVANTTQKIQFVTLDEILAEVMAKVKPRNESDIQQRIRSFSSDQNYRFFILVQNEDDLKLHLQNHWTAVFPNSRAIFVLMFVTVDEIPPERIADLFQRLWEDYDVFNLIITQPCVCNYKNLYTYDPYHKENGTWGLLKKFKVDDGINNPENYRRSLVGLNDYPLKISLFPKIPTSVKTFPKALGENPIYQDLERSLGFVGLDGMILKTLTELLRLTPEMASEDNDFGYEMDGKYYGNLGEIVNRTIDISFNSRFVEGVGLDVIEYLTPVLNDRFCIVVPKASEIPQYLTIFQCFTWRSWLIIFMIYLVSSFYWFLVRPIEFNRTGRKDFITSYIEVFCLFLSIPMIMKVDKHHQRVFFVSCMVFNIVVIGCFQGTLVKSFSTTSFYSDVNTLEDFEKSGLYIISSSQGVHNLFGDDGSAFFRRLKERIKIIPKLTNIFKRIATKRDVASVDRYADAILKIEMNYKTKHGSLIHIAKECPRSYHYTYIVPKGSPYVHVFNIIITVLREAGLLLKWTTDITQALIVEKKYKHKNNEVEAPDMEQPFSMDDMRFSFYVILGGNSLAIVVFIAEVITNTKWYKKLIKCRRPKKFQKNDKDDKIEKVDKVDKIGIKTEKKLNKKIRKNKKKDEKIKNLVDEKILVEAPMGNNKNESISKHEKNDKNDKKNIKIKTNLKNRLFKKNGIVKKNDKEKLKKIKNKEILKKSIKNDEIKKNDKKRVFFKNVEKESKKNMNENNVNKILNSTDGNEIKNVTHSDLIQTKENSKSNEAVLNNKINIRNRGILKRINFRNNRKDDNGIKGRGIFKSGKNRVNKKNNESNNVKNGGVVKKATIFERIAKIKRANRKVLAKELNFGKNESDVEIMRRNNLIDCNFGKRVLPEYNFGNANMARIDFQARNSNVSRNTLAGIDFGQRNPPEYNFGNKNLIENTSKSTEKGQKKMGEKNSKIFGPKERKKDDETDEESNGFREFLP